MRNINFYGSLSDFKKSIGYEDGPISEYITREYPTAQEIAKMRTDAARFKPIRDTRNLMQKIQSNLSGNMSGQATIPWEEGQVISTVPARKIVVPFFPDIQTEPYTKIRKTNTKKKK